MRYQLRKLQLPLAMLVAILLLVDAEIVRRFFLYGFSTGWVIPEGSNQAGHEPDLFVLVDRIVFTFLLVVQVALAWLIWQLWRDDASKPHWLHSLLEGERIVWKERNFRDFEYTSTLRGAIVAKATGIALFWGSAEFVEGWRHPSWSKLPYLILASPIPLWMWAAGSMLLLRSCQIQIIHGQFRFRRFFAWGSVPIESISRATPGHFGGINVTVSYQGKRHKLLFNPEDNRLGPSPLPVIQFLEEVCGRNAGSYQFGAAGVEGQPRIESGGAASNST